MYNFLATLTLILTLNTTALPAMARFTNIGMPRKTFVASAAEEAERKPAKEEAEASEVSTDKGGKRKGWGRDPEIASE